LSQQRLEDVEIDPEQAEVGKSGNKPTRDLFGITPSSGNAYNIVRSERPHNGCTPQERGVKKTFEGRSAFACGAIKQLGYLPRGE